LASAFPGITAALVHDRSERANSGSPTPVQAGSFHAALKELLVSGDDLASADNRAPLG
jgi:hypothetical protein